MIYSPQRFTQTEQELLLNDYASINRTMMQWLDRFVAMAFTVDYTSKREIA